MAVRVLVYAANGDDSFRQGAADWARAKYGAGAQIGQRNALAHRRNETERADVVIVRPDLRSLVGDYEAAGVEIVTGPGESGNPEPELAPEPGEARIDLVQTDAGATTEPIDADVQKSTRRERRSRRTQDGLTDAS